MAETMDARSKALVVTVTSQYERLSLNIGSPISRSAPKKRTRYGTRMP